MYIFGIDIPIMEILFVFLILFVIGFIIIVFDLKKLRTLIKKEEEEIDEFEQDLKMLENFEKKENIMPEEDISEDYYKKLKTFLKKYLKKGVKERQLKKILRKKGWDRSIIKKALKDLKK